MLHVREYLSVGLLDHSEDVINCFKRLYRKSFITVMIIYHFPSIHLSISVFFFCFLFFSFLFLHSLLIFFTLCSYFISGYLTLFCALHLTPPKEHPENPYCIYYAYCLENYICTYHYFLYFVYIKSDSEARN